MRIDRTKNLLNRLSREDRDKFYDIMHECIVKLRELIKQYVCSDEFLDITFKLDRDYEAGNVHFYVYPPDSTKF